VPRCYLHNDGLGIVHQNPTQDRSKASPLNFNHSEGPPQLTSDEIRDMPSSAAPRAAGDTGVEEVRVRWNSPPGRMGSCRSPRVANSGEKLQRITAASELSL